ncbi:MAG: aminopeptidase P N-terminal domain-containing protein [Lachnospiraceae bacterium]
MEREALNKRRENVLGKMENGSVMILYSGIELHVSADEYFQFEVNKNFFYLTGIARDHMILFLDKTNPEKPRQELYIEQADPKDEKWFGKKLTLEEAKEESGISSVSYLSAFTNKLQRMITDCQIEAAYFDTYRETTADLPDYNCIKAQEFAQNYVGLPVKNASPIIAYLRMAKDEEEIAKIQKAVDITQAGLLDVMHTLKPGMYEYQAQANYEYRIKYLGSSGPSFQTIAGSGYNGTMLHYETNQCLCKDGDLLLMDLGSKYEGYCSDITRTYPINGTFTPRQKQIYDIVLKANETIAKEARPGVTTRELNEICEKVLARGLMDLGIIEKEEELSTYYMHGVSHHLGLDVHDVTHIDGVKLRPGAVISNEPGLYIEEENIGIRIEDDLLITEDGCRVLSKNIIKTTEEIEAAMKSR